MITSLGATINHIVVSDLSDDTFFAKIVLQKNGTTTELDCRPSDAIALAVRAQAPIYADADVVERAGVKMDAETGTPIVPGEGGEETEAAQGRGVEESLCLQGLRRNLDVEDLGTEHRHKE